MKKVTDQEFQAVKELRDEFLEIISTIGELHLSRTMIKNQLQIIEDRVQEQEKRFAEFQNKEKVIYDELQKKYGTGNISMETGEIIE